jgi:hypothetical protein
MGMDWDPESDQQRSRENRGRWIGAIGIVLALSVAVIRMCANQHEREVRDESLRMSQRINDELRNSATAPGADDGTSSVSNEALNPPPSTEADLMSVTTELCKKLLQCNPVGVSGLDQCRAMRSQQAADGGFARDLLVFVDRKVLASCGALGCDNFGECYMSTLQAVAGNAKPQHPLDAQQRAALTAAMCDVLAENAGKIPDLQTANPTPKMKKLQQLMATVDDVNGLAEVTKSALINGCPTSP